MNKVAMLVHNRRALVDADQVKKLLAKQDLVTKVIALNKALETETSPDLKISMNQMAMEYSSKIIKLNRTIRKNVQFI